MQVATAIALRVVGRVNECSLNERPIRGRAGVGDERSAGVVEGGGGAGGVDGWIDRIVGDDGSAGWSAAARAVAVMVRATRAEAAAPAATASGGSCRISASDGAAD